MSEREVMVSEREEKKRQSDQFLFLILIQKYQFGRQLSVLKLK